MNEHNWTDSYSCDISAQHCNTKRRRLKMFLKTFLLYWYTIFVVVTTVRLTHTQRTQNAFSCYNLFNAKAAITCSLVYNLTFATVFCFQSSIRQALTGEMHRLYIRCLVWLHRLGQTNVLSLGIKDGIVLPDEDISQDPELVRATLAEAGAATVVALWRDKRK